MVAGLALMAPQAGGQTKPAAPAPPKPPPAPANIVLLKTAPAAQNWTGDSTIWRYWETWATDVAKLADGKIIRVDPYSPREGFVPTKLWSEQQAGKNTKDMVFPLHAAEKTTGSPPPPEDWAQPGFDDSNWVRTAAIMGCHYRALSLVCVRGKFEVNDPAAVGEVTLQATFQGGAVFYVNGQEIGRANLPAGKLQPDTLADEYPRECFVAASEKQLLPQVNQNLWIRPLDDYLKTVTDTQLQERYKKRFRTIDLKVPAAAMRQGANVLAVEVHRAAADEAMFGIVNTGSMGYNIQDHRNLWWNRCSLEGLTLSATATPGAVTGRTARPKGIQVWNWPAWVRVDGRLYGDPAEPLKPIHLDGARNGSFSGQVVVSSTDPIMNLSAQTTDLAGPAGAVIAKANVLARFAGARGGIGYDVLEPVAPAIVTPADNRDPRSPSIQPVWVTVQVPPGAQPGDYAGKLTLIAEGLPALDVPLTIHVSGYALPDTKDFALHMGFVQSPDTVALRYNVPMWSEAHWALIEQSFKVLATVATKELTIPMIRRTHFGNELAMIWWVRQADGTLKPDLHLVDRYIETAVRHLGKVPVVTFYISEGEEARTIPRITEFDPVTGQFFGRLGPVWGTDEAVAFWKPAIEGIGKILAKHGLDKSLCFGYHADGGNGPQCDLDCIKDLTTLAPESRWVRVSHMWFGGKSMDKSPNGNPWARVGLVGNYGVFWDPDKDKPFFGWQNPYVVTAYTRGTFFVNSSLMDYRICAEAILLTGRREPMAGWGITDYAGEFGRDTFPGMRGYGPWGGDYWPVLKGRGGSTDIIARYNDPAAAHWDPTSSWSTTGLNVYTYIVGDGAAGPVPTVRSEVMRESIQEAEARIFVQNPGAPGLDEARRAKLGEALAAKAKQITDQRTRDLRYLSEYTIATAAKEPWKSHFIFNPALWQQRSAELYDVAGEVAKALGKP
jgi:hypothetical protein